MGHQNMQIKPIIFLSISAASMVSEPGFFFFNHSYLIEITTEHYRNNDPNNDPNNRVDTSQRTSCQRDSLHVH